tara:strand:+ start:635 stop:739 length:105 start_codon:yes stop_codon:yes gene_type:complete
MEINNERLTTLRVSVLPAVRDNKKDIVSGSIELV